VRDPRAGGHAGCLDRGVNISERQYLRAALGGVASVLAVVGAFALLLVWGFLGFLAR